MKLFNEFKKRCPKCSHPIALHDVKDSFYCSSCGTELSANSTKSWFWIFVLGIIIFPVILACLSKILGWVSFTHGGYIELKFIMGLIYAVIIFTIRPLLLHIHVPEKNN